MSYFNWLAHHPLTGFCLSALLSKFFGSARNRRSDASSSSFTSVAGQQVVISPFLAEKCHRRWKQLSDAVVRSQLRTADPASLHVAADRESITEVWRRPSRE